MLSRNSSLIDIKPTRNPENFIPRGKLQKTEVGRKIIQGDFNLEHIHTKIRDAISKYNLPVH